MSANQKNLHAANDERRPVADPELREQPGEQERPLDDDEELDETLDDTFPASDPAPAKHIDGPNN